MSFSIFRGSKSFHNYSDVEPVPWPFNLPVKWKKDVIEESELTYRFENHFHPYVGELIDRLLKGQASEMQAADTPSGTPAGATPSLSGAEKLFGKEQTYIPEPGLVAEPYPAKELDFSTSGSYSIYNWELFYHIPLTVGILLSRNHRFEEARKWFHYIFDPTDDSDGENPRRFWKVRPLQKTDVVAIEEILRNLTDSGSNKFVPEPFEGSSSYKEFIRSLGDILGEGQFASLPLDLFSVGTLEALAKVEGAFPIGDDAKLDATQKAAIQKAWKEATGQWRLLNSEAKKQSETMMRASARLREDTLASLAAWKENPFQPHVIARHRPSAYMFKALMAYLDNLIAWGDSLFRRDTRESINEATQLYVLAASLLGRRPQRVPNTGGRSAKSYRDLRERLDEFSNAFVELESDVLFDAAPHPTAIVESEKFAGVRSLVRNLYFCVPRNDRLVSYWDTVSDRLFKIRNSLNIEGAFRQLPLSNRLSIRGCSLKPQLQVWTLELPSRHSTGRCRWSGSVC